MRRRSTVASAVLLLAACACAAPLATGAQEITVEVSLSPMAAKRLATRSEGIIVDADFYGDPTPAGQAHADQIGRIDLGGGRIALPVGGAGTARIPDASASSDGLRWVNGPVSVNINVYSARLSGPDNILACDFFDGTLQDALRAPITLRCGLIEENPSTRARS